MSYAPFKSGEATNAIVVDIGRRSIRFGYAGEESPRARLSTFSAKKLADGVTAPLWDLHQSSHNYNEYTLQNPIGQDALVQDFDLMVQNLERAAKSSAIEINSSTPLLFTEKPYNTTKARFKTTEILFESTDIPALFLAKDAVLACYSVGRATGVVCDVGDCATVTPVFEGWVPEIQKNTIQRGVGVKAMQHHMLTVLDGMYSEYLAESEQKMSDGAEEVQPEYITRAVMSGKEEEGTNKNIMGQIKRKEEFHQFARLEMASRCLEDLSSYSIAEYGYKPANYKHIPKIPYTLPDNKTELQFGTQRFECGEILLGDSGSQMRSTESSSMKDNASISAEFSSNALPNIVCESAFKCDREQQAQLLGSVVLVGGGACAEGTVDRMRNEVEAIIHTHTPGWKVKVLSPPAADRANAAWIGGSILGSLPSMGEFYISRSEYEEHGASIVYRKCP